MPQLETSSLHTYSASHWPARPGVACISGIVSLRFEHASHHSLEKKEQGVASEILLHSLFGGGRGRMVEVGVFILVDWLGREHRQGHGSLNPPLSTKVPETAACEPPTLSA